MEFVFFWVVCSALVGWWASKRGRLWFDYLLFSLILSPLLAGFVLLVKPDLAKEAADKAAKNAEEARREQERQDDHERQLESIKALAKSVPSGGVSVADELAKLAKLRDEGVLTPDEFAAQKSALLAGSPTA